MKHLSCPLIRIMLILLGLIGDGSSLSAQVQFSWPLEAKPELAGSFGEIRKNHFHSGLDFRTGGVVGWPVKAVAAGCVSRIRQGPSGFGLAVYLDHDTSFTSVYAHLHQLTGPLADYLDSVQWADSSFSVDISPDSARFCYVQDEVIAISGNSGSSEGPHLHFELREQSTQRPLNPAILGMNVPDSSKPVLEGIAVFLLQDGIIRLDTLYSLAGHVSGDTITIGVRDSTFYLGFAGRDTAWGANLGIQAARLKTNTHMVFDYRIDRLDFDETRYVNAHMIRMRSGTVIERLHRLPNDRNSIFKSAGDGRLTCTDTALLVIEDMAGVPNVVNLVFQLQNTPTTTPVETDADELIPCNSAYTGRSRFGMQFSWNETALYQPIPNDTNISSLADPAMLSDWHPFFPEEGISLHTPAELKLPANRPTKQYDGKRVLVRSAKPALPPSEVITEQKSSDGYLQASIRNSGWYAWTVDTVPPTVAWLSATDDPVSHTELSRISCRDSLAGISSWRVEENGRWKLSAYDTKSGEINWPKSGTAANPVLITVELSDRCGNQSRFSFIEF